MGSYFLGETRTSKVITRDGGLSTPGRSGENESFCQADEWIADHKLWSNWKREQSWQQQGMCGWTVW